MKRSPTPGSVRISFGSAGLASNFWRSWPMKTLRYWVSCTCAGPQTEVSSSLC